MASQNDVDNNNNTSSSNSNAKKQKQLIVPLGYHELNRWMAKDRYELFEEWANRDPSILLGKFAFGHTFMHLAARRGQIRVMQLLYKVDKKHQLLYVGNAWGEIPLRCACNLKRVEATRWLLEKTKLHARDWGFPLETICTRTHIICDDVDELRSSVDARYRVLVYDGPASACAEWRYEAKLLRWVHLACEAGSLEVLKYLVNELDASLEEPTHGATPLRRAVMHNRLPVVQWLMQECRINADVLEKDRALIRYATREVLHWMLSYMVSHTALDHTGARDLCARHFLFVVEQESLKQPTPERPQTSMNYKLIDRKPSTHSTTQLLTTREVEAGLGFCRVIAKALLYSHIITTSTEWLLTWNDENNCHCPLYIYVVDGRRIGPRCLQVLADAIERSHCDIRRVHIGCELPPKEFRRLHRISHDPKIPVYCSFPSLLTLAAWAIRGHIMKEVTDNAWQQHPRIESFQPPHIPQEVWERLETVLNAE